MMEAGYSTPMKVDVLGLNVRCSAASKYGPTNIPIDEGSPVPRPKIVITSGQAWRGFMEAAYVSAERTTAKRLALNNIFELTNLVKFCV